MLPVRGHKVPVGAGFTKFVVNELLMIKYLLLLCIFGVAFDDDDKSKDDRQPSITELINQLSSPKFEVRQQASRQLWLRGREAEAQLRIASETSDDREVRERAGQLVEMFDLGVYHDTPRAYAQSVIDFHQGDHKQRGAIIARLNESRQWTLALQLIATIDDYSTQFNLIRDRMSSPDRIVNLLIQSGDIEAIDSIFTNPLMVQFYPDQCAWVCITLGNHEEVISQYKTVVESIDRKNWQVSFLAQLYSATGQPDQALALAEPFLRNSTDAEANVLANYYFYLCGQNDRWKTASNRIDQYVDETKNNPAVHGLWDPQIRRMLIHQLAAQTDRFEKTREEFDKTYAREIKPNEAMRILLTLKQTDAAVNLAGEDQVYEKFEMLCGADRFVDAFNAIGMPLQPEKRKAWFEEEIKKIRAHIASDSDPGQIRKAIESRKLLPLVIFNLGLMGYDDEAMDYMSSLSAACRTHEKETLDVRQRILRFAKLLDRPAKFWDLLEENFDGDEYEYLIDSLWDDNEGEALQWLAMLESEIKSPVERFRTTAAIMNVSWKDPRHTVNIDELVTKLEKQV